MGTGDDLDPMPDWLLEAAVKVSRKLGIERNWFNDAAEAVAAMGLPDGMLSRADPIEFGKKLTVLVASRSDLIALKCFAALDPQAGRKHLEDLVDLKPSHEELNTASEWLLNRDTSKAFRDAVEQLCLVRGS